MYPLRNPPKRRNCQPLTPGLHFRTTSVSWAWVAGLALLVALGLGPAGHSAPQEAGSFAETVDVSVVNVDVYVTDRQGNPITGLTADDFELREDGKKVSLEYFAAVAGGAATGLPTGAAEASSGAPGTFVAAPPEPLRLVVFVDNLNVAPQNRNRVLDRLRGFLKENTDDTTRVMVASYDGSVKVRQGFTSDPALVEAALKSMEKISGRAAERRAALEGAYQRIEMVLNVSSFDQGGAGLNQGQDLAASELDAVMQDVRNYAESAYQGAVNTTSALSAFVSALAGVEGRKAVIHVSDGVPLVPGDELVTMIQDVLQDGRRLNRISQGGGGGGGGAPQGPGNPPNNNTGSSGAGVFSSQQVNDVSHLRSEVAQFDVGRHYDALTALANANRVTFYTINGAAGAAVQGSDTRISGEAMLGSGGSLASIETVRQNNLQGTIRQMADQTGGVSLAGGTDVDGLLKKMMADFHSYYSLGFSPSNPGDGKQHGLKVKLKSKKRGTDLRYRQAYIAKPPGSRQEERTHSALILDAENNDLGLELEIEGQEAADGAFTVALLLKIPIEPLVLVPGDGFHQAGLKVYVATMDDQGNVTPVREVPLSIKVPSDKLEMARSQFYAARLPLQMRAGEQKVAIGVWDQGAGDGSFINKTLQVGAGAAADGTPSVEGSR